MGHKSMHLVPRHPRVVTIYEKAEDISGTTKIVSEICRNYKAVGYHKRVGIELQRNKPSVLLLAMSSVSAAIDCYLLLIEHKALTKEHTVILLCNKRDVTTAFHCCVDGVFDDYFVHQPLYEKLRLVMAIQQAQLRYYNSDIPIELSREIVDEADQVTAAKLSHVGRLRTEFSGASSVATSLPSVMKDTDELSDFEQKMELLPDALRDVVEQLVNTLSTNNEQGKNVGVDDIDFDDELIFDSDPESSADSGLLTDQIPDSTVNNRILVVEDNGLYRDMLVSVLKTEGFETDEACDGLVALNKIRENEYQVILMDLFMPNLDGLNTTKQLRKVAKRKDTPIIALTGNRNKEVIRRWASYGLKGYIIKPSNRLEILTSVEKAIATQEEA